MKKEEDEDNDDDNDAGDEDELKLREGISESAVGVVAAVAAEAIGDGLGGL